MSEWDLLYVCWERPAQALVRLPALVVSHVSAILITVLRVNNYLSDIGTAHDDDVLQRRCGHGVGIFRAMLDYFRSDRRDNQCYACSDEYI